MSSDSEGFESADDDIVEPEGKTNIENVASDVITEPHKLSKEAESITQILSNSRASQNADIFTHDKDNSNSSVNLEGWDVDDDIPIEFTDSVEDKTVVSSPRLPQGGLNNVAPLQSYSAVEEEDGFQVPKSLGTKITTAEYVKPTSEVTSPTEAKEATSASSSSWSSWGGWGVSNVTSLLSSATEGVQNLTMQVTSVGSGITSVIGGGIEGLLDAPDPAELARLSKDDSSDTTTRECHSDNQQSSASVNPGLFGITNIIGGVSQLGSKVISGGLDTLENLGKKTMEVLQEGDPGFKKKRAFLFPSDKPILSQVLREAKEKSEAEEKEKDYDIHAKRKVHYETLFDDFHGLVHLEALEMISKQCEIKVRSLLTESSETDEEAYADFQDTLQNVKDLCELPENDDEDDRLSSSDLKDKISTAMENLSVSISFEKLSTINFDSSNLNSDGTDVHKEAITHIAKFTSLCMEFLHRMAEAMILADLNSPSESSEALISIVVSCKNRVSSIADDYCTHLTEMDAIGNSALVTNIYLEASNSNSYLDNAFALFIPILQLGALS